MTAKSQNRAVRRFFADSLAGLGLFIVATALVAGTDAFSGTLALAHTANFDTSMALPASSSDSSILVLALVFSLLFAFNAAFFRHLSAYSNAGQSNE